ncbi:MAG: DUF4307 domain-containing protein [Microbacteriaceae bacterium]
MQNTVTDRYAGKKNHYSEKTARSGNSRRYLILISVLVGLGVVIAGWFTFANPQNFIETHVTTFAPLNDHQIRVKFQVGLPTDQSAVCAIQALSAQKAIVGYKEVQVLPSKNYLRTFDEVLETVEPAVTGLISYCFPD